MTKKTRLWMLVVISMVFVAAASMTQLRGSTKVLVECLRPTTVELMPLPEGCVETNEPPPANLMRIVEYQKKFYHLALQRIIVCRMPRRFPQSEPGFSESIFSQAIREQWLPLYVGCCSYQFRRHVAVVVGDAKENGTLIVEAALIQSRWAYVRLRM